MLNSGQARQDSSFIVTLILFLALKTGRNCTACPYIREVKSLRINGTEWKINQSLNCEISNCIYMIECKKITAA